MRFSRLLFAVLTLMLIAGCGGEDEGNPTGGGNNNPPNAESTEQGTANGAPASEHGLGRSWERVSPHS